MQRATGGTSAGGRAGAPGIEAPAQLAAWRLDVEGHAFALLEWPLPETGPPARWRTLSPAEAAVATLAAAGTSNARIALERRRSARTVANQIASIFRKLGVRSRAELAVLVSRGGGRAP